MWLKLKSGKDTLFLANIEMSRKYGAFAVPGIDFSCFAQNGPYIRIAYSYVPKDEMDEVISLLHIERFKIMLRRLHVRSLKVLYFHNCSVPRSVPSVHAQTLQLVVET